MAEEKRLIGDDGRLARGTLASTVTAATISDATDLDGGYWYKIVSKASASSIFGDLAVNDFYYAPVDVALHYVGAGDLDSAYKLTLEVMVDLAGWSLELTADEVEVTVLKDSVKKYRKGKLDANGSASFVFIKGETDQSGSLANYYFGIAQISAAGVVTYTPKKTDSLYIVGYLAEETEEGEVTLATVMQVEFFNFSLPMNSSEAVNMDIPFRLIGDTNPILYRITMPAAST